MVLFFETSDGENDEIEGLTALTNFVISSFPVLYGVLTVAVNLSEFESNLLNFFFESYVLQRGVLVVKTQQIKKVQEAINNCSATISQFQKLRH